MSADTCIIGTRGSKLALWQAHAVERALRAAVPGLAVEVHVISTKGDRVLDKPLAEIGDKGLFTKELERALLAGEVDMCVHSMKDLPTELPEGCRIAAMLPRADVRDALVCGPRIAEARSLADLSAGTRLGTGSRRRVAQLRAQFPQVEPMPMRGNVDTRLSKANGDDYDGAILAAAGLARMGRADAASAYLPVEQMVPAAGQGAVGVEVRAGDARVEAWCAVIRDASTMGCVAAERQVMRALGGGCQTPVGAYLREEGGRWVFDAVVLSLDGSRVARSHREAEADAAASVRSAAAVPPSDLVATVLSDLRNQGAWEILAEIEGADADGE